MKKMDGVKVFLVVWTAFVVFASVVAFMKIKNGELNLDATSQNPFPVVLFGIIWLVIGMFFEIFGPILKVLGWG